MIFQSIDFVIFLLVLLAVYWLLKRKMQNLLLLAASYVFYGYVHPWLLSLLFGYTLINYGCSLAFQRFPDHKRTFLLVSIGASLAVLGFFKYFNFFVGNVNSIVSSLGAPTFANNLDIFLPIGISFYTFQTLSYTIDVYRGRLEPRTNFIDFALFISFFPQLVAGPIERASRLLPQFERARSISPTTARDGLFLIVWGFFKKLVIADNVAIIADRVFLTEDPGFAVLWAGVFAFSIQIYADFSGYTDIARGVARLFGFDLVLNFNHPYLSKSPTEFWRRWHMSLSNWFRDFVYIPLGGSRSGAVRNAINLLLTFLLTGLWHGASWNFVLWGLYHGLLIQGHRMLCQVVPERIRASRGLGVFYILLMLVLTNIGWLIFRETDFGYLVKYLTQSPLQETADNLRSAAYLSFIALIYSIPLWLHPLYEHIRVEYGSVRINPLLNHVALKTATVTALFVAILVLKTGSSANFIYFQF